MPQSSLQVVLKLSQSCLKIVPKLCQCCLKVVPNLSRSWSIEMYFCSLKSQCDTKKQMPRDAKEIYGRLLYFLMCWSRLFKTRSTISNISKLIHLPLILYYADNLLPLLFLQQSNRLFCKLIFNSPKTHLSRTMFEFELNCGQQLPLFIWSPNTY